MKKILLLGASAMMASAAFAVEPKIYDELYSVGISPDGKTMVSATETTFTIVNLETGQKTEFEGNGTVDSYSLGQGNAFSSAGVIVGSGIDGRAAYYQEGEWVDLNTPYPEFTSCAEGITADGTRICGNVGMAKMSIDDIPTPMQVPAVWDLKSDGTYGDAVVLPYPEKDFSGRVPTYVTAMAISDDGKTVVGQVYDYSGGYISLIFYTLGDDDQWSYNTEFNRLVNPDNVTFPEDPGESPEGPDANDYLTEEQQAAYQAAINAYYEEIAAGNYEAPFPEIVDFMSPEQKAAYEADLAAYQTALEEWQVKFTAYYTVFEQATVNAKSIVFNNVKLTPDGKTAVSTIMNQIDDPTSWLGFSNSYAPVVFNIEDNTIDVYPDENVAIASVTSDGSMIGFQEGSMSPRRAMVYAPGARTPVTLVEYYEQKNAETADWVKANMCHDIEMYDMETGETYIEENVDCTGTPLVNSDFSVVVTAAQNLWDPAGANFYTYVIPAYGSYNGIQGVAIDADVNVKAFRGGRILISGNASRVTVYDMEGRVAYDAVPAGSMIETGLAQGTYIVKVQTADGAKTVKAMF